MESHEQLRANLFEHCLGAGNPSTELLERGTFPANWVSRYVALVERASHVWRDQSDWPREVIAAIHFASFYLEIRYQAWQHGSARDNPATRKALGEIRRHSELFLLSPVTDKIGDETKNG
jgi:hypothetical protein